MKYKLIKEYPSSDPVGTIVEKSKSGEIYQCSEQSNFSYMTIKEVENYPEFWEEIIEKNDIYNESWDYPFMNDFMFDLKNVAENMKKLSEIIFEITKNF